MSNPIAFLLATEAATEATAAVYEFRDAILDAILELDASLERLGIDTDERADICADLRQALLA